MPAFSSLQKNSITSFIEVTGASASSAAKVSLNFQACRASDGGVIAMMLTDILLCSIYEKRNGIYRMPSTSKLKLLCYGP